MAFTFSFPYEPDKRYQKKVAYLCMEYGIDQALKIYAGGLGFLAGSHLRSAYDLKQHFVAVGILWKYGYYTQVRKQDQRMDVLFEEKRYGFLTETNIRFTIRVAKHDVHVAVYYLDPLIFQTAPLFLLSTDVSENDYLAQTISHKLYDANPETNLAASILLGEGSVRLFEQLSWQPECIHLNESHALPLYFQVYKKVKDKQALRQQVVYTNHTPEPAGNKISSMSLLEKMGFFCDVPLSEIRTLTQTSGETLDHTQVALKLSRKANAVSKKHLQTLEQSWASAPDRCPIVSITNGQHFRYWHQDSLYRLKNEKNEIGWQAEKKRLKRLLFELVADQCGEIYHDHICTLVFAKRFSGYKRHDLLLNDMDRFEKLINNNEHPVQIIWAGKPYPMDYAGIGTFDKIAELCKNKANCVILTGYELNLSKRLKAGADVWLNMPRLNHEASGTSGISAAMNGAVNVGIPDGWYPEFAKDKQNGFVVPAADSTLPDPVQDEQDADHLFCLLEQEVLPLYYDFPSRWTSIAWNAMDDIYPMFDSNRMADEYYQKLYSSQ